ncbi:hypothetical protein [Rhodococcus erythropolis]|jgi:hypothetical protein|uniref:hypothetical protein n=1 Tax=Rhodococcus erythropolis TaxID=1833 RepID=UPI00111280D7|nr:hypothetical protein [Rhodococcus erythropolis]MDJ0016517.1 hypothetical protein [Rhodococcus erythropolis]
MVDVYGRTKIESYAASDPDASASGSRVATGGNALVERRLMYQEWRVSDRTLLEEPRKLAR